jgi:hypothetical protein
MLVNAFKTSDELCIDYVMIARKIPVVFGSVDVRQVKWLTPEWLRQCGSESGSEPTNL